MNKDAVIVDRDEYIEKLKASRKSPAVLKIKLASLRGNLPKIPVFAFEGDDEKAIYYQWIRRIRPDITYEPFPCGGKKYVLTFRAMLSRDLGNIRDGVYFFIDRDFDDLAGYSAGPDLFMTDRYSLENYLVTSEVLTEILKNEFHCHAEPATRKRVLQEFEKLYKEFLHVTQEINRRIFIARRLDIKVTTSLPDKINQFTAVNLTALEVENFSPGEIVKFSSEPSAEQLLELDKEFVTFDPACRYRGKFAISFFLKWLHLVAEDRIKPNSTLFPELDKNKRVKIADLSLGMLASKSLLPTGLDSFIMAIE